MKIINNSNNQSGEPNTHVCVIGAANIDIVGLSKHALRYKDDNIGQLNISMGGVGRNIAENLVRMEMPVKLICPIGDDVFGKQIIAHCSEIGIDINDSLFLKNQISSTHVSILDDDNDMALGLSDMSICDKITTVFIAQKKGAIRNAKLVVLETNLPSSILSKIIEDNPQQKYFLDTVSGSQCERAKKILRHLFILKTNQIEAEILSGIKITNEDSLSLISHFFHQEGTKHVFITLGKNGAFYSNGNSTDRIFLTKKNIVNTNGAGDAFSAGVIFGAVNNYTNDNWLKMGMACANHTVMFKDTVSPTINRDVFRSI